MIALTLLKNKGLHKNTLTSNLNLILNCAFLLVFPISTENSVCQKCKLQLCCVHMTNTMAQFGAYLNTMFPLSAITLINIHPSHYALPMPIVVSPFSFINVAWMVSSHTVSMTFVVHPVALIERMPFCVILDPPLLKPQQIEEYYWHFVILSYIQYKCYKSLSAPLFVFVFVCLFVFEQISIDLESLKLKDGNSILYFKTQLYYI